MAQTRGKTPPKGEVLALRGLTGQDYMTIDGARFMLAPIESYGLRKRIELQELVRRVDELETKAREKADTEDDEREYDARIREVVAYALPKLPAKKIAKLTPGECQQISAAFFVWLAKTQSGLFEVARWAMGSSSRGSRSSTGAANGS